MKAVFLSDAHLKNTKDEGYRNILKFFDLISDIDNLYLAGDFFDFWFCRDQFIYPEFVTVIDKLVDLQSNGVHVTFCEGNHDFYLDSYFSKELGMTVFAEWANVDMDGRKVLVSHGDTVDSTNKRYLFLRKILRSNTFYELQKKIPLFLLWRLARLSSMLSKKMSSESSNSLADKMEVFSQDKFEDGFDVVILGHCHKPQIKETVFDNKERVFITLGDWVKYQSYVYYENGRFELKYFNAEH